MDTYSFEFLGVDKKGTDEYLKDTLVYRFESEKSRHRYVVRIERYVEHLHCIKFYDDTYTDGYGKFSILSGTFEPRRIFRTVASIALDSLRRDPDASFFFIGAADERDVPGNSTKRYQVYRLFAMNTTLIPEFFEHYEVESHSLYLLANSRAVTNGSNLTNMILSFLGVANS